VIKPYCLIDQAIRTDRLETYHDVVLVEADQIDIIEACLNQVSENIQFDVGQTFDIADQCEIDITARTRSATRRGAEEIGGLNGLVPVQDGANGRS
jgi:hypothetical protein